MKKILFVIAVMITPALFFSAVPVRYAEMYGASKTGAIYKNSATLTNIILKEFGERALLNLFYTRRNASDGYKLFCVWPEYDSTYKVNRLSKENRLSTGAIEPRGCDSIFAACLGTSEYLDIIERALLSSTDTLFIFRNIDYAATYDLSFFLKRGKWVENYYMMIYQPKVLKEPINDTATWEVQAIKETKALIDKARSAPVKLMRPESQVPDSLKNAYFNYMNIR